MSDEPQWKQWARTIRNDVDNLHLRLKAMDAVATQIINWTPPAPKPKLPKCHAYIFGDNHPPGEIVEFMGLLPGECKDCRVSISGGAVAGFYDRIINADVPGFVLPAIATGCFLGREGKGLANPVEMQALDAACQSAYDQTRYYPVIDMEAPLTLWLKDPLSLIGVVDMQERFAEWTNPGVIYYPSAGGMAGSPERARYGYLAAAAHAAIRPDDMWLDQNFLNSPGYAEAQSTLEATAALETIVGRKRTMPLINVQKWGDKLVDAMEVAVAHWGPDVDISLMVNGKHKNVEEPHGSYWADGAKVIGKAIATLKERMGVCDG